MLELDWSSDPCGSSIPECQVRSFRVWSTDADRPREHITSNHHNSSSPLPSCPKSLKIHLVCLESLALNGGVAHHLCLYTTELFLPCLSALLVVGKTQNQGWTRTPYTHTHIHVHIHTRARTHAPNPGPCAYTYPYLHACIHIPMLVSIPI